MLTNRQKLILQVIVDDYVQSAEPVGSRSISKRNDIKFSSATVRNEMADLEEMGYLTQPHTSAGRIPSNKGYRYYVDYLITSQQLSSQVILEIRNMFTSQYVEFRHVIEHTASILSELTNYTAIVLGPEVFDTTLKHIQLVSLSDETAVAIIVTNTGYVENRKVSIPKGISIADMERLFNILNQKLVGVPLFHLKQRIHSEISSELRRHMDDYSAAMEILQQALDSNQEDKIFLGGQTNIFAQPEFRDVEKVRQLFELLEREDRMQEILSDLKDQTGVQVRIGHENMDEAIFHCSMITASYSLAGRPVGTLGILGPTRMEYRKVISILRYLTRDLNHLIKQWHNKW